MYQLIRFVSVGPNRSRVNAFCRVICAYFDGGNPDMDEFIEGTSDSLKGWAEELSEMSMVDVISNFKAVRSLLMRNCGLQ